MPWKSGTDYRRERRVKSASKLTQYIGLTRVFSNPDIESYEIVCYDAEDYALLKEFLVPVK